MDKIEMSIRENWKVGDACEIHSESKGKWYHGTIFQKFVDEEGEWLEVKYLNGSMKKQIQRFSSEVRPARDISNKRKRKADPTSKMCAAQQLAAAIKRRNENFRRTAPPFHRTRALRSSTFTYPASNSMRYGRKPEEILADIQEAAASPVADVKSKSPKSPKSPTFASMTPRQVKEFVGSLGSAYVQYVRKFRRLRGRELLNMSEADMLQRVPTKLHRNHLLLEIARRAQSLHLDSRFFDSLGDVQVLNWSTDQVRDWLNGQLVCQQYANAFANHGVDGLLLFELDAEDLDTIGVKKLHRRRVLDIIARFAKATFPDFQPVVEKKGSRRRKSVVCEETPLDKYVQSLKPLQVQNLLRSVSGAYQRHVRDQHGSNQNSRAVVYTMGQLLNEMGRTLKI